MLVLTRRTDESIVCQASNGEIITITIVRVQQGSVRVGISAPPQVSVHRPEVLAAMAAADQIAAGAVVRIAGAGPLVPSSPAIGSLVVGPQDVSPATETE